MGPRVRASAAVLSLGAFAFVKAASAAPPAAPREETAAAREQARQCERLDGDESLAACRQALALGIGPARRSAIRLLLSRRLAALERWDELVALLRESVALDPADAVSWQRLGGALLFGLDRPSEAVPALEEAVRLRPDDAPARLDLAAALASAGRFAEAGEAFDAAVALDPAILDSRPAARAARDAARAGRRWPQ